MKTETKTIYKCDFCNRLYQIKPACEKHETSCNKNPDNDRACFGCSYLIKKSADTGLDDDGEGNAIMYSLLHCKKIKSYLYPPKVEHKGTQFEVWEDEPNNPMPKECEHFDDEQHFSTEGFEMFFNNI